MYVYFSLRRYLIMSLCLSRVRIRSRLCSPCPHRSMFYSFTLLLFRCSYCSSSFSACIQIPLLVPFLSTRMTSLRGRYSGSSSFPCQWLSLFLFGFGSWLRPGPEVVMFDTGPDTRYDFIAHITWIRSCLYIMYFYIQRWTILFAMEV